MRILFDQGTPVPLRQSLSAHRVSTDYEMGWSALANGDLLDAAEGAVRCFCQNGSKPRISAESCRSSACNTRTSLRQLAEASSTSADHHCGYRGHEPRSISGAFAALARECRPCVDESFRVEQSIGGW